MDQIAIISDIHGNKEALKTALKDIKKRGINKIYCLGDIIAKGVHAHECIKLIKENCDVVIQGNCDEYFTRDFTKDENPVNKEDFARINWNNDLVTEEDKEYLRNLQYSYEFYLSGRLVRLFHATPDKINGFVGNIDKLDKFYSLFMPNDKTISNEKADVVVCGHIHTPYMQKIYNRIIINAGSVGNAFDVFRNEDKDANVEYTTLINYVILKGNLNSKENDVFDFEFVNLPYDIDKELSSSIYNVEKEEYNMELKKGNYRDLKKLEKSFIERGINIDEI